MHLKAYFSFGRLFCKMYSQLRHQPCPRQRRPAAERGPPGAARPRGQCAGAAAAAAVAAWGTRWRSRGGTPRAAGAALQVRLSRSSLLTLAWKHFASEPAPYPPFLPSFFFLGFWFFVFFPLPPFRLTLLCF